HSCPSQICTLSLHDALPIYQMAFGFAAPVEREMAKPLRVPLAERMRPNSLSEVVGHRQILGKHALLPRLIERNRFGSLLFYGPPGCGKTTLARVVAASCKAE